MKYLFLVTIFLLPFQFALNLGDNIDLVTTRVLVPIVFLLWLLEGLARRNIWIVNRAESWLILSFLFLSLFSLWGGLDPEKGVRKTLYLFSIFPIFLVAADLAREEKFRKRIFRAIWVSGTLAAILALGQFILPFVWGLDKTLKIWKNLVEFFLGSFFGKLVVENPSWLVNVSGETWMRAFGFFPDPHTFSFFASLCFFIGLGYFAWERNWKWKILAGVAAILTFLAIIFSFSRGAYFGVLAGSLFFLAIFLIRLGNAGKMAIIGVVLIFLAAVFFQGTIQSRLASAFNFKEGSNAERIKNWRQAVKIIKNYPLTGIGLGNYASYINPALGERSSVYAHNLFLDIAAETGILNGIIFLVLILVAIWRNISTKNILGLGIASSLVYFLVHGTFDTPLWSPQVMVIFFVVLALGLSENNAKLKYQNEK
jgi:putative inorganic carbon (HCO3(-)) transporter